MITAVEGDKVKLRCDARGNPPPEFQWVIKGTLMTGKESGIEIKGKPLYLQILLVIRIKPWFFVEV